jgi:predicted nucleic acid-binding protein
VKVVVNATPLIALSVIGQLSLLHEMFEEVIVPAAVYEEVVTHGRVRPGAAELAQANWLQIMPPRGALTIEPMLLGLDAGELSVLLLARELQPDWVVIDERLARRVAQAMGLPVKGTLGILLAATWAELLSKEEAIEALERLLTAGIRVSPRWQNWFRSEVDKA